MDSPQFHGLVWLVCVDLLTITKKYTPNLTHEPENCISSGNEPWAMVNTHYMVDGHPIHNKDPYNGYYKSLWTIGWLAPINGY